LFTNLRIARIHYDMPRLGIAITHEIVISHLKEENKNKLDEYLDKIYSLWGESHNISLHNLKRTYNENWVEIVLEKVATKKKKYNTIKAQEEQYKTSVENCIEQDIRCRARTWSDPPLVYYDKESKKWILGEQCKRKHKRNQLCGIHLRNLPHGTIDEEPPHKRFDKYKKR
jgi:hypothetical protein